MKKEQEICQCEMPTKVHGKNKCWRCKRPFKKHPQANDVGEFPKSTWEVDALRRKVNRLEAEIQSLKHAIKQREADIADAYESLVSVLCDADGEPCIDGSGEDLAIIDMSLKLLSKHK